MTHVIHLPKVVAQSFSLTTSDCILQKISATTIFLREKKQVKKLLNVMQCKAFESRTHAAGVLQDCQE